MDFSKIPSPCFVLDEKILRQNLLKLAQVRQDTGIKIVLALKGFAFWASFPLVKKYLDGATASSYFEAKLCNETLKSLAHCYAPAYMLKDFIKIKKLSSHITFNSLSEFKKYTPSVFSKISHKKPKISYGLRVNILYSNIALEGDNPCAVGSRFGVDLQQLKNGLPEGIEGLHVHCLCDASVEQTAQLIQVIDEKLYPFLPHLKWLNIGGGHLLTHTDYDTFLLKNALVNFQKKYPNLQIIMELATAVSWDAGVLRTTVLDILNEGENKILVLNINFLAHIPDSLSNNYKVQVRNSDTELKGAFRYEISGASCHLKDNIGVYSFPKPLRIGDDIILENMMAYTMVKTNFANGLKPPNIGIWRENGSFDLVKKFDYKNFKAAH
jgi:carboxynorspermidine decarboxylase